jgi:ribonuclease P protein component
MLPKSKRLTTKDFSGLKTRIIFRGTYVDVATFPSETTRFACVVSKKRVKRAVDRNVIRRKVYSTLHKITLKKSHFVIIYPKQNVLSSSHINLEKEISSVFATL